MRLEQAVDGSDGELSMSAARDDVDWDVKGEDATCSSGERGCWKDSLSEVTTSLETDGLVG